VPILRYPHVIFYRIADNELLILHIRHTSRRPIDPATEL
jgi:plasmid stabilization system protein ParE